MGNCLRKLVYVLIMAMAHSCCQLEARDRPPSKKRGPDRKPWSIGVPRYVVGGVIGSTLGVGLPLTSIIIHREEVVPWPLLCGSGIGHAIQGRWWDGPGWGFTMGGFYTSIALSIAEGEKDNRPFTWTMFLGTKLAELITLWLPPYHSTPTPKEMPIPKYLVGAILGTVFGFGSGHLAQGRGIAEAWPYTLTQISALSMFATERHCSSYHCGMIDGPKLMGMVFYIMSKVIEIASVWGPSARDYHIVSADKPSPKLALIPLLDKQQPKLALQLTMAL